MIYQLIKELLVNQAEYEKMSKASNPYGDGQASKRIVDMLLFQYGLISEKSEEF